MPASQTAFYAYPSSNSDVTQSIRAAIEAFNRRRPSIYLEPWEKNDISGVPVATPIFEKLDRSTFLAADVTFLNENVAFEIGYAIGARKRCLLFVNTSFAGDRDLAKRVGIFDTLGYETYENSVGLADLLSGRTDFQPLPFDSSANRSQPIFVVEPEKSNEAHLTLVSRLKKARWRYRSFNPDEDVRLAASEAINHVAQSSGIVAPLQSLAIHGAREHNLRAMFVAGIAAALEIPTLIIHAVDFTAPLDVRDRTRKYRDPNDILEAIQEFSLEVTEFTQRSIVPTGPAPTVLTKLSIGDPTAENEMTTLSDYYLSTDEYQRALRGEVNLVVGRKGAGKTALWVRLRDSKRGIRTNIVVDLKPEGYQLVKLREQLLDLLTAGAQQHLITALWEYILLLEITYKVLEKDREYHTRDHRLTKPYEKLSELYGVANLAQEGDFRERLSKLSDHLIEEFFRANHGVKSGGAKVNVTTNQITEVLYQHDIRKLRDALVAYLSFKGEVWLLFDNIDKGWSVEGVGDVDLSILRCLINASRRIEREFRGRDIDLHSVIFVRDDVYSLLMRGTADYGKEMRASLDWSDKEQLGNVLLKRLEHSLGPASRSLISTISISHYKGVPWLEFLTERSLMRPRYLLKIFRFCVAYAINAEMARIDEKAIEKGLKAYAQDLVIEANRELTDIFPKANKLIYEFSEERARFSHEELIALIQMFGLSNDEASRVIDFMLYYGFLGVSRLEDEPTYIYDVNYDIEMLKVTIRKWAGVTRYLVNPALWPALKMKEA